MKLALTAQSMHGQRTPFEGELVDLSTAQRLGKALGFAGVALAIAAGAIFIPVVHFVVPPLAALTGIIGGVSIFAKTRQELREMSGTCPSCGASVHPKDTRADFPVSVTCPSCEQLFQLQRDGD